MARTRVAAALAAVALAVSGCGFQGLYSASLPGGADLGNHPFSMSAEFTDALDLVPQSAVKVNDVAVGKVTGIKLADCKNPFAGQKQNVVNPDGSVDRNQTAPATVWCAKVSFEVNDSVHLPANARAQISQTSLLGEKYVNLMQPVGVAPAKTNLGKGSNIPLAVTDSAPEVEEVLGALSLLLNGGGLQQIRVIAQELNSALRGHEGAARDMIAQLNQFVGTLNAQKDDITNALVSIDHLAVTLNQQRQVLTSSLDIFPQALHVLNGERDKLVTLLTSLAHLGTVATGVINATQTNLVLSLKALDPVVTQLSAAGDNLPQSLRIIGTFPFPLGTTRQLVRGDYANLDAIINLNLSDELCGLNKALCNLPVGGGQTTPTPAGTNSAGSTKAGGSTTGTSTAGTTPTIIGSGR